MIYVLTSIVNGWDNLRPPLVPASGARWICYTNNPLQPRVEPWEYLPLYDVGKPCRTARVPKILPHLMLPDDAEYSIWQDANFQLRQPPQSIVAQTLAHHDWAAYTHPGRLCIYIEGKHCIEAGIGTRELLINELAHYREQGHPEAAGLWANGFLVRRHTEKAKQLCELWWTFFRRGGERDQISFPVARRLAGLEINTLQAPQGDIWSSPFAKFNFHAAWITRDGNQAYLPERAAIRGRLSALCGLTGTGGGIEWPAQ